ncbi:MAG: hypothetical protein AAFQ98_17405 [Bacteroidota bacterium]
MRKEKLQKLGNEANAQARIDYSRYNVEEGVSTIADALVIPLYVARSLIVPVLFPIALAVVIAILADMSVAASIFYVLLAWVSAIPLAVLTGLILLLRRIGQDVTTLFHVALDTTLLAYEDANKLKEQAKEDGRKASLYQVFQGVTYFVILPTVHKVLGKKLPLMGWLLAHIIDRVFSSLLRIRQKDFEAIEADITEDDTPEEAMVKVNSRIDKLKKGTGKTIKVAMKVLSFPLFVAGVFIGSVTVLLELLWWSLFG